MDRSTAPFLLLQEAYKMARDRLPPALWDYLIGGAETETTLRRNRHAFDTLAFRPRVLRDVSCVDCGVSFLGERLRIPVLLAPIGSLQNFHPRGNAASAGAAARFGVMSLLSSVSEPRLEEVAAEGSHPMIYQLYVRDTPQWADEQVRRAVDTGCTAICLTVDLATYGRRERDLAKRHVTTTRAVATAEGDAWLARLSWDDVKRIRDKFDIPMVLKGIATAEDAVLACEHGVEVVYVSNHGGRQLDHARATLDILPEVVEAIGGRAEIVVDGGVLRGSDVVKAMAVGARAVGIGRLVGFGISVAGESGIVRVLEILEQEIQACLGLLGVSGFHELDRSYLQSAPLVLEPGFSSAFPLLEEGY